MARNRRKSSAPRYAKGPFGYGTLPVPAPGYYDPSIDASEEAARRGYRDYATDTRTGNRIAAEDYGIGLEDIKRTRDYGLADLLTGRTRAGQNIDIEGAKVAQDYARDAADNRTALGNLLRNYQQLGDRQGEQAAAMGVDRGGALMQAMQKRQANLAIDRAPIDTAYARLGENHGQAVSALDLARTRSIEDFGTSRDRLTTQYGTGESTYKGGNPWADAYRKLHPDWVPPGMTDNGLAGQRLSLDYQRGVNQRATGLQRTGREFHQYQADLVPVRYLQATGGPNMGTWQPPKRRRQRI